MSSRLRPILVESSRMDEAEELICQLVEDRLSDFLDHHTIDREDVAPLVAREVLIDLQPGFVVR